MHKEDVDKCALAERDRLVVVVAGKTQHGVHQGGELLGLALKRLPAVGTLAELLVDHQHDGEHVAQGPGGRVVGPQEPLQVLAELERADLRQ